jgi:hypothetical protein
MNDFDKLINILTEYSERNLTFRELDTNFTEFFVESNYEYTEEQSDILEDLNDDIGYTLSHIETKDEMKYYISEEQLREKITNHLKELENKR